MKKLISLTLAIIMVLTTFSVVGSAEEGPFAWGYIYDLKGKEFRWELSADGGALTITGEGAMDELQENPEWNNLSFSELVIAEGIENIPEEAFVFEKDLESVKLSSTVKAIGQRAFYGCEKLVNVDFANVEKIESMAFYGCMAYKEVKLPETVKEIENYAFGYYCNEELDDALAKIDNVTIFAKADTKAQEYAEKNEFAFINLSDYTKFFEYIVLEDDYVFLTAFKDCPYSDEIIIPSEIEGHKVRDLADNLFSDSDVKSVYVPATITNINPETFENASELTEIICQEGGEYLSVDGILYDNNGERLLKVPEAKTEINEYPENLEVIEDNSFRRSSVKEIVLPETVKYLEESVFAFSKTEKIVLPETITEVPEMCFYGSENLVEVVLPETVKTIGANAFSNCSALEKINLPYGLETIDGAAFHCAGLKNVIIPDSVKNIGNYAFGYYSSDDIEFVKDEEFEIQGRSGTVAEEYAIENAFKFTDVSPEQPEIWYAYSDKVSVTLFWEQTEDAESYEIYRKTVDSEFIKIAEIAIDEEPVYSDLTVFKGETYTYSVVAVKGNLRSSYEKTVVIEFVCVDTPELLGAEMTRKGISVEWSTVFDAEGYILYRKTENTDWEEIAVFKGNVKSYEDTTCKSGETYSYTVRAYSGAVESGCDYDGVSAMYLSIPKLKNISNASTGIKITWEKVKGANRYIIGRKSGSSGWSTLAVVGNVNSYIDKTAKVGTTYTYTVVSVCDDVTGFYDTNGLTYKRIANVKTESATNTSAGIKVTWKPVSGCTGYRVYRKDGNGSYKRIATVKGAKSSNYTDKSVKSGIEYSYRVVAYSGSSVSAYNACTCYYLDNPTLSSVQSGKSGVTAKWKTVKGASGYYVYRKEGNGYYKKLATVKGGSKYSYLDKSAKKGKTYSYKVKAYYSKSTSAYSNAKSIKDKY